VIIQAVLFVHFLLPAQIAASPNPEAARLLQSAADAESHGNLDQAIADLRKAVDLDPSSAIALLKLGDAYFRKQDYGAATQPLQRAAELSPDSLPAHRLLGYALLSQGYAAQAIPHLEIAHESGALGIAQLQADQPAEAVVNLKNALAKNPDDPDLVYYLARAAAALSSEFNEKLLTQFPQTARGHEALGQNYYSAKMFSEAEKEYEKAIALRPDLPGLHLELGEIYAASSQSAKAEEQFRSEARLQPGNAEAAYRLGDVLLQAGKMKEAAEELRRSDSLRPDMPETLCALARALAVSDPNAAERALDRVIALEKDGPLAAQAYLLLAGIHRRQGESQLAAHDMEEYKRIHSAIDGVK
jgi:cytochrome c-type biogenesis protein CcmH/NrfG